MTRATVSGAKRIAVGAFEDLHAEVCRADVRLVSRNVRDEKCPGQREHLAAIDGPDWPATAVRDSVRIVARALLNPADVK